MAFIDEIIDGVCVLKSLTHTANISNSQDFKNAVTEKLESGVFNFVLDLSEIDFIDSTFLGSLVIVLRKIVPHGGDLRLFGLKPSVSISIGLTRLNSVFKVYTGKQEAIDSFKKDK